MEQLVRLDHLCTTIQVQLSAWIIPFVIVPHVRKVKRIVYIALQPDKIQIKKFGNAIFRRAPVLRAQGEKPSTPFLANINNLI
jgi:hypothetical protein